MNGINKVVDLGIPVNAEESRTAAICINRKGEERFVIAARGFVMIVNLETDEAKQVFFPEQFVDYPFASYSSEEGLFYTGAGKMFMVLDPFEEKFIDHHWIENGEEIAGFSFAEDADGQIYFTSYPGCGLYKYCSDTKSLVDFGSMDETEKYPSSLAVDSEMWIYIGIGTERKNIVAFQPETGKKLALIPQRERTRGTAHVYKGEDGSVYGSWEADDVQDRDTERWHLLLDGSVISRADQPQSPSLYSGVSFEKIHRNGRGRYQIEEYSLAEGFVLKNDGNRIALTYQSEGAKLSTLFVGPDEYLYGTSQHPLHLFRYGFEKGETVDYGASVIEKGGGGNICAYASQGMTMVGFAYAGGKIYEFDLHQPIGASNPTLLGGHEAIHRPRCALSHQDGRHIVWGGFPGYGMTGGGLGIYDVSAKKNQIIPHTSVIPNQSTVSLGQLPSGDLLGGTSIDTPGGASTKEQAAFLYLFDWEKKAVTYRIMPDPKSREISQLFIDSRGCAHCLTIEGSYFIFDNRSKEILGREDISDHGTPVRNAFASDGQKDSVYVLLSKAVLKLDLRTDAVSRMEVVAQLEHPASSGIAYRDGRLYFGSGSRLMSIEV